MIDFAAAVANAHQPQATYEALEALVDETIGVKLFTLMEVDHQQGVARRTYSNMPSSYPSAGEKPIEPGIWTEIVQDRHEIFVANTIEEIAAVFGDFELIQSLGCESCLNLPIVVGGDLVGTLNCLNVAGHYTKERVEAANELKSAGALTFLLAASLKNGS